MPRVLVVDDEPLVLDLLVEEFRTDFEVVTALSYDQAIARLDSDEKIDAVVADWRLGHGPDGLDLLRLVRERLPSAPRLMVSGHVGDFLTEVVVSTGVAHLCVSKPWDLGTLRQALLQLLASPSDRRGSHSGADSEPTREAI